MIKKILSWFLYLLVLTFVLAIEQLYGVPFLFFAVAVLATSSFEVWFKQLWLVVLGVLLAALYGLALAAGVVLMAGVYGGWLSTGIVLKNSLLRLLITAGAAWALMMVLTGFAVTVTTVVLCLVSASILVLMTRIFVLAPDAGGAGSLIRRF